MSPLSAALQNGLAAVQSFCLSDFGYCAFGGDGLAGPARSPARRPRGYRRGPALSKPGARTATRLGSKRYAAI